MQYRWERIHGDGQSITEKMELEAGTLYRNMIVTRGGGCGLTFVPKAHPQWSLTTSEADSGVAPVKKAKKKKSSKKKAN